MTISDDLVRQCRRSWHNLLTDVEHAAAGAHAGEILLAAEEVVSVLDAPNLMSMRKSRNMTISEIILGNTSP